MREFGNCHRNRVTVIARNRHGRIRREEAIGAGVVSAANELLEGDLDALPEALEERAERLEAALG